MTYAKDTAVSVDKTQLAIKNELRRYGATAFAHFESAQQAAVAFEMNGRRIQFRLPLPDRSSRQFTHANMGARGTQPRTESSADRVWEQACRSRWRGLLLCIKAKLESVEAGIETFEDAFLAHIQMPDGMTVGEHTRPAIARAYETNSMQPLLPGPR